MLDWPNWLKTHDSNDTPPSLEPGYGCGECETITTPVDYEICVTVEGGVSFQFKVWDPTVQEGDKISYKGPVTEGSKLCETFKLGENMKMMQTPNSGCGCVWTCGNTDPTDLTGCSYKLKIDAIGADEYTPYEFNGSDQQCKHNSQSAIALTEDPFSSTYSTWGLSSNYSNDFTVGSSNQEIDWKYYECLGPNY